MNANALPRIMMGASERTLTLREHELTFGRVTAGAALEGELDASGLLGRGGANFSTAKKVELLRSQRGHNKLVVVNAMEGEPVGHKDRTLLSSNPHLVLDGAQNVATLIGARHVAVCVSRKTPRSCITYNARCTNASGAAAARRSNCTLPRGATSPGRSPDWCTGSTTTRRCRSTAPSARTSCTSVARRRWW